MGYAGIVRDLLPADACGEWHASVADPSGIAILGVVVMVPGIAMVVQGGTPAVAAVGAILSLSSMAIFLITVLRHGFGGRSITQ